MRFQQLSLEDIGLIGRYFDSFASKTCDYTVGGMFMWRDFYHMEYAVRDGVIFTRLTDTSGKVYYNLPLNGDLDASLGVLKAEEAAEGKTELRFCTVPEEYVQNAARLFPEPLVAEQEEFADYLYAAKDLIELKGRKYSGQRNQISQFVRHTEGWSFQAIDRNNIRKAAEFFEAYCESGGGDSAYAREENRMVKDVLQNLNAYGFFGGILEADGAVIGFSLGELVNRTLFTHVEKADRQFPGAYQMLVNQFARTFADGKADFINREEDMGDPGLRRAKEAYHPFRRLKKFTVEGRLL